MLTQDYTRKSVLSRFSKKKRKQLIETADLKTKWERYTFARYRNLEDGEKVHMKQLTNEIETTFRTPYLDHLVLEL